MSKRWNHFVWNGMRRLDARHCKSREHVVRGSFMRKTNGSDVAPQARMISRCPNLVDVFLPPCFGDRDIAALVDERGVLLESISMERPPMQHDEFLGGVQFQLYEVPREQ